MTVSDVPQNARGGAVLLGDSSDQSVALTDPIRGGDTTFSFGF
jgi:hypothetical protein